MGQASTSAPAVTSRPVFQIAPEPPPISDEDVALLVKSVRAALRDELAGKPERAPGYRPPALRGVKQILHATLRRNGAAVADTETKEIDLIDGSVAAGVMLGRSVKGKKIVLADHGDACGLELEWLGPIEYVTATNDEKGKWTDALLHCFEPGRECIGVELNGRRGWMRPSQIIVLNLTPDLALQAAEKAADVQMLDKSRHAKDVRYFRFRTRHVWQADATVRLPVQLVRGEQLIPPDAVTQEALDAAIHRMGRYLKYRQNSDGWYSEEYLPSPDRYAPGNSAVLQMHALQGLASYGAWSKDESIATAAAKGIMRSAYFLTPLIVPKETSALTTSQTTSAPIATTQAGQVLAFPGHGDHLLVTARMLLSMLELGDRPEFVPLQAQLVEAVLASQDEDGRIEMIFEAPSRDLPENALAAGIAMQALASVAAKRQNARMEIALQRADRHYHRWYDQTVDSAAASEVIRALARGYISTNDARASDLVFRFLDDLIGLQLTSAETPWPELIGAIDTKQPGLVGIDTASYLLAMSDGLELARRIGDLKRVERYQWAVRLAARFVMQLEITESGAYYARSRVDSVGGVRQSPWNNIIRSDSGSEAVMSLIAARRALFPSN
ncbi:MAG: hypothetical protein AABZ08_13680 [Planctomycetota bacterium]